MWIVPLHPPPPSRSGSASLCEFAGQCSLLIPHPLLWAGNVDGVAMSGAGDGVMYSPTARYNAVHCEGEWVGQSEGSRVAIVYVVHGVLM